MIQLLGGFTINSKNISKTRDSDYFEYTWQGRSKKHHFKRIKKRVRFSKELSKKPNDILLSDVSLLNCSNVEISRISNKGFTVGFTGIKASENSISFNWKTV